jgi:hypothetical protein
VAPTAILAAALALALAPAWARAASRPAYGGELRVALPLQPRQADPALALQPQDLALAGALHATPLLLRPGGQLAPGLLTEVPAARADGRVFHLVLRRGLRFADGSPLGAEDLAASLARLLRPDLRSPHAWAAVAIQGADEVLEGRGALPSGLQVLSERELLVTLAFPFPDFAAALAALPAAVVSPSGAGAGAFRPGGKDRLAANPHAWRGRPLADTLVFSAPDQPGAARGLEAGTLDLSLRPEPSPGAASLPFLTVAYALVNARRLGEAAPAVRSLLASLDQAELARRFLRAPAEPLPGLLPPGLTSGASPAGVEAPARGPQPGPIRLGLLVPAGAADPRAVAERLQVKLFDAGLRPILEPADPARFQARLAAGDFEVALLVVPLLTTRPALAAAQVAGAVGGPLAARRAERALSGLEGPALRAAAEALRAELDLWPLYAAGGRVAVSPALRGLEVRPDGGLDLGDLWRLGGAPP